MGEKRGSLEGVVSWNEGIRGGGPSCRQSALVALMLLAGFGRVGGHGFLIKCCQVGRGGEMRAYSLLAAKIIAKVEVL